MKRAHNTQFKILYGSVVSAGLAIISIAGYRLIHDPVPYPWLVLSLLTVAAGSLSVNIPGVNGRVSVGDALISLSVLLFGPLAGAVTAALEGIAGSLRCRTRSRRLEFLLFNAGVMAVSVYTAGLVLHAIQGQMLFDHGQVVAWPILPGPLMLFAVTYFAVNTFLVAAASALDKSANVFQTWRDGFLWTAVNYIAAAFISGILVQFAHPVTLPVVATLVAGCGCVYVSAQTYIRLARQAQNLKEHASSATAPGKTSYSAAG
jgi:hypothetical protein